MVTGSCAPHPGIPLPAVTHAVPVHRVRIASQLRENSWGPPWYAACSLIGHAGAPERAHQGGTGMSNKRLAITRGKHQRRVSR